MKLLRLLIGGLGLLPLTGLPAAAQSLDPTFSTPSLYAPGSVYTAVEQPNGKRIVTGNFTRANGVAAPGISCFDANGTLDAVFQQNVGSTVSSVGRVTLGTNGQLWLNNSRTDGISTITAGGLTRNSILRLNADGTADASFDSGTGAAYNNATGSIGTVEKVLPLANGQVVAIGFFDHYNGIPAGGIARFGPTGTRDLGFATGAGFGVDNYLTAIIALPNGKFLVGGNLDSYDGHACNGVVRLNADGSYDPSFVSALNPTITVSSLILQPDGNVLVGTDGGFSGVTDGAIVRLLPTGARDPSFTSPFSEGFLFPNNGEPIQLQPDGKIIVVCWPDFTQPASSGVVRLNADGTLDASFQVGTGTNIKPDFVTLLASGQVLVGGRFTDFSGAMDHPLVQLTSSGTLNNAFQPLLQVPGTITAVARQPDGKLIVGGNFSEINGQFRRRLTRLNPDGTLDATFATTPTLNTPAVNLILLPDGRLTAAFTNAVRRFLPDGTPDNTLVAPRFNGSIITRLLQQPDGRLLVSGSPLYVDQNQVGASFLRLQANGALDGSFIPGSNTNGTFYGVQNLALQPNGSVLAAGEFNPAGTFSSQWLIARYDANGILDPSYATNFVSQRFFLSMVFQPDGKLLISGSTLATTATTRPNVTRLNANGSVDASFVAPAIRGKVHSLVLQDNGRVLIGGAFVGPGLPNNLARLLPNGAPDASFAATTPNAAVQALLVQPDGKIIVGGAFTDLLSTPTMALARIGAPNVLAVAAPAAVAARTAAWPVPAHGLLHVAPDPSAHAQSLELVDLLGRSVRRAALAGPAPTTLSVEALPAGIYLLRVAYAEGTVTRRVQVQ